MSDKWKKVKLGSLGDIITGKTPKTNDKENYGNDVLFLTPSDNMELRYIKDTIRKLSLKGAETVQNKILPKESICVSCIGSQLGKVVITIEDTVTNQQINSIIPNDDVDYKYLYYAMLLVGNKLNFLSKTSNAVPIINKTEFSNQEIYLPPLEEQKSIADLLSSFDDKIENNNAIIANLEEQAQTIFKSWFVDNPKDDWKQGTVTDLGKVIAGGTPSKKEALYYADGDIPWITPKDLSNINRKFIDRGSTNISQLGLEKSSAKLMPRGTVLFSSRAPIGYIAIAKNNVSTNQGFKSIRPFENIGTPYVYFFLKNNVQLIENMASGSTFKEISGSAMKKVPAVIPDNEIIEQFNSFCKPLFKIQEYLELQNIKLEDTRDTLLPKLMSGEIRVEDTIEVEEM